MIEDRKLAEATIGPQVRSEYERIHRLEQAFLMSGQFTDLLRLRQARDKLAIVEDAYVEETQADWERHHQRKQAERRVEEAKAVVDEAMANLRAAGIEV